MGLSGVVTALVLLTSCGGGAGVDGAPDEAPDRAAEPSPTPSSTPEADVQLQQQSGAYDLALEDVSVTSREGRDRVVLRFAGTGSPGWSVRYVDEAVMEGSGERVDLDGDTVLQIDVSGTPTAPGRSGPVTEQVGVDVVDLHSVGAYEGLSRLFVGLRGDPAPYEVSALAGPSRLVVEIG